MFCEPNEDLAAEFIIYDTMSSALYDSCRTNDYVGYYNDLVDRYITSSPPRVLETKIYDDDCNQTVEYARQLKLLYGAFWSGSLLSSWISG